MVFDETPIFKRSGTKLGLTNKPHTKRLSTGLCSCREEEDTQSFHLGEEHFQSHEDREEDRYPEEGSQDPREGSQEREEGISDR